MLLLLQYIKFSTNHGEEITVPSVAKLTVEQAEEKLDAADLEYVLLDTTDYNPDYPKFSVVKQDPLAGAKVKAGRKIYIKINSSGFTAVRIPNLIEQTLRQAEPSLKSIGLEVGEITYKPYIGKDMVLEMSQNGKELKPGDKVLKSSKIDLVVGDGKVGFEEEIDTTATPQN
jgi:beta-lactam-binding protein with PASTA domain